MNDAVTVLHWYAAGARPPQAWFASPGVDLAEDIAVADGRLSIHRPLRLTLRGASGTLILRLRPLSPERRQFAIWTSTHTDSVDWFEMLNQRVQQHRPHLRRLPDMYRPDAWTAEEYDAMAPTHRRSGRLRAHGWSRLVLSWDRQQTRAWIDDVPVAEAPGSLQRLLLTAEAIEDFHSLGAATLWDRLALIRGVELSHAALLDVALDESQIAALGDWSSDRELVASIRPSAPTDPSGAAAVEARYRAAAGIRLRGVDCEPTEHPVMRLDLRDADRERYWHYGALSASDGQCLYAPPQDQPLRWSFQVTDAAMFELFLHAQQMMPWPDESPRIVIAIDDEVLGQATVPATTAGGSMRPEALPFKPIPTGMRVQLEAGWHTISLRIADSPHLAIDELLLTPEPLDVPAPDTGYVRPPMMRVSDLTQDDEASVYTLVFTSAGAGRLALDAANDPGPTPSLSTDTLTAGENSVLLTIPRDRAAAPTTVRRLRLVHTDDQSGTRMPYVIRHRERFARASRPALLQPTWLDRQLPADAATQASRLAALRAQQPTGNHHNDATLRRLCLIAWLSGETADLQALHDRLMAVATELSQTTFGLTDGETRADVRGDYGGGRRGSQFGEIWPEDAFAYDLLLAHDRLSEADQLRVEANLFWPGFENSKRMMGGELASRGQAHSVISAALAGVVLQDEPMLRDVEDAMIRFGTVQIRPDGGHNEKVSSYGASISVLVDVSAFLLQHGRPRVFETCRDTIRAVCDVPLRGTFTNGAMLRQGDGGLQGSFHIFGIDRMLAQAASLFPDDPALRESRRLVGLQEKRLRAKWDHQPPETWPQLPPEAYRASDLFADSGWAILRSPASTANRLEASLDWSSFGDHGHPDKLHMNLLAFDEVVNMDLSYGWTAAADRCQNYAMRTISHNTVVVDQHDQLPGGKGTLRLFSHDTDLQVCWADAGRCYAGGVRADRCLILLGDTLVDLFHLRGGQRRRFDWMFHCLGEQSVDLAMSPRGPLCPPRPELERVADYPGYDYLDKLETGCTDSLLRARWRLEGYHQMGWTTAPKRWLQYPMGDLHVTMLGSPETTVIRGDAPYPLPDPDSRRPFLMVRREAREQLFAAVYQARDYDQAAAAVQAIPVTLRGRALPTEQAVALQIRHEHRCITILQRHVAGPLSAGPIRDTYADLAVQIDDRLHEFHATKDPR